MPPRPIKNKNMIKIKTKEIEDLKNITIPSLEKSFDELTVDELVHLKPGDIAASDITLEGFSSDISISNVRVSDETYRELSDRIVKKRQLEGPINTKIEIVK